MILRPILFALMGSLSLALPARCLPPDHPLPLVSREVNEDVAAKETIEKYYRFNAGPGLLTVTLDMQTDSGTMIDFEVEVLDAKWNSLAKAFDTLGNSATRRLMKDLKLKKSQALVLKLTAKSSWGTGHCRVRLGGPVDL